MPVGKMDILITLQQATETRNTTSGQLAKTWADWNTAFAEVITKTTTEGEKTQQLTPGDERTFRIRYIQGVTAKMRIYDAELERYYDITGITPEGRKNYLLISARSINVNAPV